MRPGERANQDLLYLRQEAERLAASRKESPGSLHVLAALTLAPIGAASILRDRGLTAERVLAGRAPSEEAAPSFRDLFQRAMDVARRMGQPSAHGAHMLLALLNERQSGAFLRLGALAVDVPKLRAAAMNQGLGLVGERRLPGSPRSAGPSLRPSEPLAPTPLPPATRPGQVVSVIPQPAAPRSRRRAGGGRSDELPQPLAQSGAVDAALRAEPLSALPVATTRRGRQRSAVAVPPVPAAAPQEQRVIPAWATLDPERFPVLTQLGRNWTESAFRGDLEAAVGRHLEVQQVLDVLAKRGGNSPCLVGDPGVGKTSVARAVAHFAASPEAGPLDRRIVVEIPIGELVAGTGVRGALAGKLAALRKEVLQSDGRVVLFFDELHLLFQGEGSDEAMAELKPALARGELPCMGATHRGLFGQVIAEDPTLGRRFTAIEVEEPTREDAFLVLDSVARGLAEHHGVSYPAESLALTVSWTQRYLQGRRLPDKAVAVLDLAGARARRRGLPVVEPEVVAEVVAEQADVPAERLMETDRDRMLRLEELLQGRVVGHEAQLGAIARILRRHAAGFGGQRPLGTFLLLGPTGVGKTETAKAVAEALFQDAQAMTRIDMSEYAESHAVAKLIGAPPGYLGHDAGGQLTEAVRRRPYQVLLLDEIEKAHRDVLMAFLGVFDEGRLTDSRGRLVDFSQTVILLTSNLGASAFQPGRRRVGFGAADEAGAASEQSAAVIQATRAHLAPELFNRLDEVLVFQPLGTAEVSEIAQRLLQQLSLRLEAQRGLRVTFDDAVVPFLMEHGGGDLSLGARPLKRAIARLVEAPMAEKLLSEEPVAGDLLVVGVSEDGVLDFDIVDAATRAAE